MNFHKMEQKITAKKVVVDLFAAHGSYIDGSHIDISQNNATGSYMVTCNKDANHDH